TYRPEKASYQDVMHYIQHLRENNKHPKTIRNHLFAIKIYYRYLVAEGKRNDHPCQYLYLQDSINRAADVQSLYPMKQMEGFLETYQAGKKNKATEVREKVLIGLLIYQGLTVLEISQLNIEDLNLQKGTISIKENAKTNSRTLDLKSNQILLLQQYINGTRKQLLERVQKKSKVYPSETECRRALIIDYSGRRIAPHDINRLINYGRKKTEQMKPIKIRQSLIAHLIKSGNNLRVVQVFAGHKRISTTEAYKQSDLEELKAVIDQLHPLQ
ncbi:tyrosine-type recombinase/integrase, partial [Muriicola sp.]|uniref:tyrosine-type recombinase/integrase n=1 Tax=Muriicola sp. TaxID=2020856 RepID=UPI003C754F1C